MDNLVAWWKLDDGPGSTTVADSSGNGRHGQFPSVTGHPASSDPKWVVDHEGGMSLLFDGTDYVRCGGGKNLGPHADPNDLGSCTDPPTWADFDGESFTIATWVKELNSNNWATYVGKGERAYKLQMLFARTLVHWAYPRTPAGGYAAGDAPDDVWNHLAGMWDNDTEQASIWVNGELAGTRTDWIDVVTDPGNNNYDPDAPGRRTDSDCEVTLGARVNEDWGTTGDEGNRLFKKCGCPTPEGQPYAGTAMDGLLSDVRMYNRLLTGDEMLYIFTLGFTKATQPDPRNESVLDEAPLVLSWVPDEAATSHNVYFGENLADVTAGATGTLLGSPVANSLNLNRSLEPGKVYYWRVETVSPDGTSAGDVWNFELKKSKASAPNPPDGMKWVDPNTTLTWEPGVDSTTSMVYFSRNRDEVATGTVGQTAISSEYDPGLLDPQTTYYWRVDSVAGKIVQGDLWSFTTKGPDVGGLLGSYFNNQNMQGNPVLTRIEGPLAFEWQNGSPELDVVAEDDFSARWEGLLEVPITDTYMIMARKDDGAACWIDGEVVFYDMLASWGLSEVKGFVELEAGKHEIVVEYFDVGWNAQIELLWSTDSIPLQTIPIQALSAPPKASSPRPADGAVDVAVEDLTLTWTEGSKAARHRVYFGKDRDAVVAGDPGADMGPVDQTAFVPQVERGQVYYWRIDEVNDLDPDSPWAGDVWSFTSAPFAVLDDFETYGAESPHVVFSKWQDQLGLWDVVNNEWIELVAGNGSGALIGAEFAPYVEITDVHGGSGQSLPLAYDHNDVVNYSEGTRWFDPARDFTADDGATLGLWFKGRQPPTSSVTYADSKFTLEVAGSDIAGMRDEFIFAYNSTGPADLTARIDEQEETNGWAKAGVMLRSGLDDDSAYIFCFVTPQNGVVVEMRDSDGGNQSGAVAQIPDVNAPHWVRIQRTGVSSVTCSHREDGGQWQELYTTTFFLDPPVYMGLAMTSHNSSEVNTTVFSNVTIDGRPLTLADVDSKEIGVPFNTPAPLYVTLTDAAGNQATVEYVPEDPAVSATNIQQWTEWLIPLSEFAALDLTRITRLTLGVGPEADASPEGAGRMLYDDIRIYNSGYSAPATEVRVIEDFDGYGDQVGLDAVWVDHQALNGDVTRTLVTSGGMENSQYMQWDYHSYGDGPPKRDNSESVMIFGAPVDFASYGESFKLRLSLRRRPGSDRLGLIYVKFYQGGTANDPGFLSGEAWIVRNDSNWYPGGYAPIGNTVAGGQPWATDVDLLRDGQWSTVEILPENIIPGWGGNPQTFAGLT
ncbi:MAG: PA14 domain-containing protein, partial [Planctomycetota bacterium]